MAGRSMISIIAAQQQQQQIIKMTGSKPLENS